MTSRIARIHLIFFTLFFSFFNNAFSQITISGTISDPNNNLVSGALVEIYDNNDTLNTYSATTNASGFFQISNITHIKNIEQTIPSDYLIIRNYPNPFNPSTIIYFELPKSENVEIKIFDILGREVRTLYSGFHNAGVDQISWDGRNNFNQTVSAGVYLCQLKTKNNFKVHKMVLLDGGSISSGNFSFSKLSKEKTQTPYKVNSIFNYTVKITGDSLDATYFRNLVCTKDTTLNLIVSKIIKTETIGIAGGIVGNDDFKISIPSGAFDGNYNISLIKIEDDGAFGENTLTPSFKISGIPKNYSKRIKIIAKYSGELSENSFLGMGENIYDVVNQGMVMFYNMIETYDSLGYLISEIPVDTSTNSLPKITNNNNLSDFQLDHFLKFVNNVKYSVTPHFRFNLQKDFEVDMQQVATIFENAFEVVYGGLHFFTEIYNYNDWNFPPLKVVILDNYNSIQDLGSRNSQKFNVGLNYVQNNKLDELQFQVTQRLFLSNDQFGSEFTLGGDKAIFFWLEELLSEQNLEYPKAYGYDFLMNGLAPIDGFKNNNKNIMSINNHSHGMSVFLKYLYDVQDVSIKNVRLYMLSERNSELMNQIVEWWPDFIKKYVHNELYPLPDDYFLNYYNVAWNVNSETDTLVKFTPSNSGPYKDLSAKMFKINFNYTDLDETQNLKFKMIGPDNNKDLSLILFGIKNNKLEFIEKTQSAEYELKNPKSYIANGTTGFLTVLVNSNITQSDYLGESEIDLEMRITPKIELPTCTFNITQYNQCSVGLAVNAKVRTDYENGDTKNEDRYFIQGSGNIDGSFNGNQFIGFIETEFGYDTLKVSLSQDLKFVEAVSWTKYEENTGWRIFFLKGIEASAIPINCDFPNKFEIIGNTACSYIDEIYYSYWTDLYNETISDWTCSETSHITITFSKK